MASDAERNKALRAERSAQLRRLPALQKETLDKIAALLTEADRRIAARLAAAPSEFDAFILPQLQEQVRQAMAAVEAGGATAFTQGADLAWRAGIDMVDAPIEAGLRLDRPALRISGLVPSLDTAQLRASQAFLTGKIRDITATAVAGINTELGLAVIGQQSAGQAAAAVSRILGTNTQVRVATLVRTEIGRAYSVASQERFVQAQDVVPGLKKQWRRSGRIHSRLNHDATDGQVRAVDEPFDVGAGVKLRYPRDPQGPAKETINCGCVQLPYMEDWEMSQPGRQPFSEREIRLDPRKRDLDAALRDVTPARPAFAEIDAERWEGLARRFHPTLSALADKQASAISAYVRTGPAAINGVLRGTLTLSPSQAGRAWRSVKALRKALGEVPAIPDAVTAWRGIAGRTELGNLIAGDTFIDRGFVSVSARRKVAERFAAGAGGAGASPIVAEIRIPAGATRVMPMEIFKVSGGYEREAELLIGDRAVFRVVETDSAAGRIVLELLGYAKG